MRTNSLYYIAFFVLCFTFSFGQITYTSLPMDSELVARNLNTNLGTYAVQGIVDRFSTPYDSVCLKIYRDTKQVDSIYQGLLYYGTVAPFNFSFQIPAELHEYSISVYGIENGVQTLDTAIHALVAGDVYIIEGQSNAVASARDGQNADTNKSEFIRVFANANSDTTNLLANSIWFRGEGNGDVPENGHAGQWGLRLGHLLVDNIKIPVAIFNGGYDGSPISYFQRPPNYKTSLNSDYGRLYYRLRLTKLQNSIRAIMWSQGETDAGDGTPTQTYMNLFDTLRKCWYQDFPGFKKIYTLQTKTEFIEPLNNIIQIEEAEREIALADSNMEIMSTAALKQDMGGLHFDYTGGYEEFGNRLYPLIARDIYGITINREIDAPMFQGAFMSDSTTLIIKENATALLQHDSTIPLQTNPINSYIIGGANPGVTINSIFPYKNEIVLKLSKYPGKNVLVSYIAPIYNTGSNWLTNTNGLDMICFYERPVDSLNTPTYVPNIAISSTMKIYPNPCATYTNIIFAQKGTYYIDLYDLRGRQLQEVSYTGENYRLSTEGLPAGAYLVRVVDKHNNMISSTKIEVQ